MMSGHGTNLIKNKYWTSRTLANPQTLPLPPLPLRPITSHFCLTPSPLSHPPQDGRHMCITP